MKIIKNIIIILNVLFFSCADNISINNNTQSLNATGDVSTLNIVTWNIENFPKNSLTANYVKNIIDSMNVDILALQEIENFTSLMNIASDLGEQWTAYRAPGSFGELGYLINSDELDAVQVPYSMPNEDFPCPSYAFNISDHLCANQDPIDYEYNFAYKMPYILNFEYNNEIFSLINMHLKCCGNTNSEEESRRYESIKHLHNYLNNHLLGHNIIIVGDYNDDISTTVTFDGTEKGIFYLLEEDYGEYLFTDINIQNGSVNYWSYPSWPSHLDHIVINNNIINNPNIYYETSTLLVDQMLEGGWGEYNSYISDHRPLLINLDISIP